MYKAVAVENNYKNARKKAPVWKRFSSWYGEYNAKHNRSLNDNSYFYPTNDMSHDINNRVANERAETSARRLLR